MFTLPTWSASDGSVAVQIANPSADDGVRLLPGMCLGHLSTVSVVNPDQLRVNAVANTPVTDEDIRRAKSDLEGPLSKAFSDSTFTSDKCLAAAMFFQTCSANRMPRQRQLFAA